jgi:hypothetical protein
MITAFDIVVTLLFMLGAFSWNKDDQRNLFIKYALGCMWMWALVVTLIQLGFHK